MAAPNITATVALERGDTTSDQRPATPTDEDPVQTAPSTQATATMSSISGRDPPTSLGMPDDHATRTTPTTTPDRAERKPQQEPWPPWEAVAAERYLEQSNRQQRWERQRAAAMERDEEELLGAHSAAGGRVDNDGPPSEREVMQLWLVRTSNSEARLFAHRDDSLGTLLDLVYDLFGAYYFKLMHRGRWIADNPRCTLQALGFEDGDRIWYFAQDDIEVSAVASAGANPHRGLPRHGTAQERNGTTDTTATARRAGAPANAGTRRCSTDNHGRGPIDTPEPTRATRHQPTTPGTPTLQWSNATAAPPNLAHTPATASPITAQDRHPEHIAPHQACTRAAHAAPTTTQPHLNAAPHQSPASEMTTTGTRTTQSLATAPPRGTHDIGTRDHPMTQAPTATHTGTTSIELQRCCCVQSPVWT